MTSKSKSLSTLKSSRYIFFFSIFVLVFVVLYSMPRLSVPLGVAYVFYLVLSPIVPFFEKFGVNRGAILGIVLTLFLFFSFYPIIKVSTSVFNEAQKFQYYLPKVEKFLTSNFEYISTMIEDKTGFKLDTTYIDNFLSTSKNTIGSFIYKIPNYLASVVEWVFLVPLFLFFFLRDGRKLRNLLLNMTPNTMFERFYFFIYQFNKKLGGYIFAKFVEASLIGFIITLGLLIMKVRFAFLLGIVAGLTNVIPYVGPFFGAIPALIFAATEYSVNDPKFSGVIFLYVIANAIDIALIFPILVSRIVDLHPIVVVISVVLGSQLFGVVGMIISIPMAVAIKLIFSEIYHEIYASRH